MAGTYLELPINAGRAPGDAGYTPPPPRQDVNNWETLSKFISGLLPKDGEGKGAYPGQANGLSFDPADPTGSSAKLRAALPKSQPYSPVQTPQVNLPPDELGAIDQRQMSAFPGKVYSPPIIATDRKPQEFAPYLPETDPRTDEQKRAEWQAAQQESQRLADAQQPIPRQEPERPMAFEGPGHPDGMVDADIERYKNLPGIKQARYDDIHAQYNNQILPDGARPLLFLKNALIGGDNWRERYNRERDAYNADLKSKMESLLAAGGEVAQPNHSDAAVEAAPGAYPKVKPDTTEDGSSRLAALKVVPSAAAIPTPPSANPYALNAAALPVVPTYNDVSVDDSRNYADRVNEFLAKQRTNEPTKESMQALMAPNSFGMYPKGAGPTPEDSFTKHATISMLGSPSEQQQQQVGDLVKQGYKEVNNIQSAPGDYVGTPFYRKTTDITADQLQKSDPARYKALMELQALREADAAGQAKKYQQTGLTPPPIVTKDKFGAPVQTIMQPNAPVTGKSLNPNAPKPFDMNNMEEYKVEIPGKGWMTGLRQKDPNRQQGTLSITPGLSDSERAQVDQINANQARQAAYGVSRKTGELYDASLQHQQQQAALQALKQLQMQQEQAYQNKQLSLDERKALAAENQNAMTNEYNAGKLAIDRGNMLTQGNRYAQQSAHDRANRQDSFMKDHFRKWATESPAGLKSKNPWDDFAVTNLGVLSASARTNDPPKFATPYASKTAGMIDVVYPDGKVRTVPYIDYIDALSQPAQTAEVK